MVGMLSLGLSDAKGAVLPDTTGHEHDSFDKMMHFSCIIMHNPHLYLEWALKLRSKIALIPDCSVL